MVEEEDRELVDLCDGIELGDESANCTPLITAFADTTFNDKMTSDLPLYAVSSVSAGFHGVGHFPCAKHSLSAHHTALAMG